MSGDAAVARAAKILWDFHSVYDDVRRADAIVGLGSYDLRVAERCAELFHLGLAPGILFTGNAGNWTSELYERSEAAAFADRARAAGVPANVITLEEKATNIGENIRFAASLLGQVASVILVTKPQTQRRCRATVAKQWPEVLAMTTAPATGFEDQPAGSVSARDLICEMVGDLRRLELYPRYGFQETVVIPERARAAAAFLENAGFVDHLPAG